MLQAASTDTMSPSVLHDIRTLLENAFEGRFTEDDWDHAIGGVHVWLSDSDRVISHASLVERALVCSGHLLPAGFVEAVATSAAHRRQGHGTSVMNRIGDLIRERYALGALSTGTHAFYQSLGWELWRGPTFADGPGGRERTPGEDGGVMILRTSRTPPLDLDGEIVCDWRRGDLW
jgi:aminoglycoside 2'-N-acetyltransferase I